jgi:DNA-binding CsgD family transcriptional regulator
VQNLLEVLCHTADGAYVVDDRQQITLWNQAAEALLGYPAHEAIGQPCYRILKGRDASGCPICRRDCVPFVTGGRGELVPNFDAQVLTKNRQVRWVNVSVITVPGPGDRPRAVIHLFRDIDAKKRAENFVLEVAAQARRLQLQESLPFVADGEPGLSDLTTREMQVLRLLAQGTDTAAIATELIVSEATVRNHIQRILHKLGVHSRLEAVALAREHGIF